MDNRSYTLPPTYWAHVLCTLYLLLCVPSRMGDTVCPRLSDRNLVEKRYNVVESQQVEHQAWRLSFRLSNRILGEHKTSDVLQRLSSTLVIGKV